MKYIIIEDEPLAGERIKTFAGKLPQLEFTAAFENAVSAAASNFGRGATTMAGAARIAGSFI